MAHPAVRFIIGIAVFALLATACLYPAIGTCGRDPAHLINWFDNQTVVLFGWLGLFAGQVGWFANLAFAANLVPLLRGVRPRRWLPVTHITLLIGGLATLQPAFGWELPHNEAWSEPICRLGSGVSIWATAHALLLAGALAQIREGNRRKGRPLGDVLP